MQSTIELELARTRVIRTDCGLLDAYYKLTTSGPGAIAAAAIAQGANVGRVTLERNIANLTAFLESHRPQLVSIYDDLDEIIDLLNDNAGLDESDVKARLTNILERLKQVGEYLSVTGRRVGDLNISWSATSPPTTQYWTDDNLLKEAYDMISEFIERVVL